MSLAENIEVLSATSELERLEPVFNALLVDEVDHHTFRHYRWLWPWWKAFGAAKELRLLVAREGGGIVGLLPLYEETRSGPGGLRLRRLALVGSGPGAAEDLGVIAAPRDAPRLAEKFVALLGELLPFDELSLDAVTPGSGLAVALERRFGGAPGYALKAGEEVVSPRGELSGTFDGYLASRPNGLAAQVKRRTRWLAAQPGYGIARLSTPEEIARGFDELVALHRQRFGARSSTFEGPMNGFLREVTGRLASSGRLRLWQMRVGGEPVASVLGWRWGKTFAYYQSGHHPGWRDRSVGTVLIAQCLRECFDEGIVTWDFLRGEEAYKRGWVDGERRYRNLFVRGPGLSARLSAAAQAGRTLARSVVRRFR